ncbi:MAG TPA: universal stress protein [Actinomycetota bacterium]|nr:universal stress protein [Actinomycetota bacterium]
MISKIVVGTDTSAAADLAVKTAAELARAHQAEMLVVYVKPVMAARDVFDPKKAPDPARYLGGIPGRFPDVRTRTREASGDAAETISQVAAEERADIIVVGNRGTRDRRRSFLSSVPAALLRQAPASVLVVDTRVAH